MKKLDILITGVGGQGVILASDIISDTALAAGYDVKKTDTIGMAQRGGSVVSHIRIAAKVWSPLIKEGQADILLGFEKLESARWSYFLRPEGIAIINNQALPPPSVNADNPYPDDAGITAILKQRTDAIYLINAAQQAKEVGNTRTFNTLLLGCLSVFTPFKVSIWENGIAEHLAAGLQQINLAAFDRGRNEMRNFASSSS